MKFIGDVIAEFYGLMLLLVIVVLLFYAQYLTEQVKPDPEPKQPAIIIKMDYETVKRIDARLDEIDGILTVNGLIPAK